MKNIKLFEEFINEIGDSSAKKYQYDINGKFNKMGDNDSRLYAKFESDSGLEYTLTVININKFLDVDFSVDGEWPETNRGEMFSVMATVTDVIENILTKSEDIRGIRYEPKGKTSSNKDQGKGRDTLYRAFITNSAKKIKKSVDFVQQGGTVFAMFK
jgi:hypothetical protein